MTQAVALAQQASTGVSQGFKNRIINGAMVIDQRNAGASVTGNDNIFGVDRFKVQVSQSSKFTMQQNAGSVTPPAGFTNYLGITSSSAYSVGSSDYFFLQQRIEGYNASDLDFGKSTAKTITLSFYVRSSLTGTFGGALQNDNGDRAYPFTYTIFAANTWEQKIITIAGDTSGTWLTTNGMGIKLTWGLGVGSTYSGTAGAWNGNNNFSATGATSVVGTNGATLYLTGVQLEVGSTATSFDYLDYGRSLIQCQRYYSLVDTASGGANGSTGVQMAIVFPTEMRTTPSVTMSSARISNLTASDYTSGSPAPYFQNSNNRGGRLQIDGFSSLTTGIPYILMPSGTSASPARFSAEL